MELNWLEDFLALAELRNFSRAAEARHVTQPAFSRRIRALEAWMGTPLVDRSAPGFVLNAAGEYLRDQAGDLLRNLQQLRGGVLEAAGREGRTLVIAATHALSFTFFPDWIRSRAPLEDLGTLSLISDTMAACEVTLLAGRASFLLCHYHRDAPSPFPSNAFTSIVVGRDTLVPLSVPDAMGAPRWSLPGDPSVPTRFLAYSAPSGLGRILEASWQAAERNLVLDTVFTSHLAAALLTMTRQGQGVAWLPHTLAAEDIASRRLVDAGNGGHSIPVEIRLFRSRHRQSPAAEAFWRVMSSGSVAQSSRPDE